MVDDSPLNFLCEVRRIQLRANTHQQKCPNQGSQAGQEFIPGQRVGLVPRVSKDPSEERLQPVGVSIAVLPLNRQQPRSSVQEKMRLATADSGSHAGEFAISGTRGDWAVSSTTRLRQLGHLLEQPDAEGVFRDPL